MRNESLLKTEILSRGVEFTREAIELGISLDAKMQNLCYNAPQNIRPLHPSELELIGKDGYTTVVSCVAPTSTGSPVIVDAVDTQLIACIDGEQIEYSDLRFVLKPAYYSMHTPHGWPVQNLISACGADELNIIPWRGCSITKGCKFCGINKVTDLDLSVLKASSAIRSHACWNEIREQYLQELCCALELAIADPCYEDHFHPILISGNLENLDLQAEIYCEISLKIRNIMPEEKADNLVAVITPPRDLRLMEKLAHSGIDIVVFNQEIAGPELFKKICPGKAELGDSYFYERLTAATEIFGPGKVWCNFIFGMDPQDELLDYCEHLASKGIVPGANVYHRDYGSRINYIVPTSHEIISFYVSLADIYKTYAFKPFYCRRALRTSLANEANEGRLACIDIM